MTVARALAALVLALAAARTTIFFVSDVVPLGPVRDRILRRWPPPTLDKPGSALGYLWTCPSCMSVWHVVVWFGAYLVWPAATLTVALPFAAATVARAAALR